jgi:2-polyprenyl-3-methyl-5-hydroxy-6-metoxy-1,4-benzoquinol methylase
VTARSDVSAALAEVFSEGPWLRRTLQQWRPYICPFEVLVDAVPERARVFDIGCGAGLFLLLLAKTGRLREGVGFDLEGAAIAYANHAKTKLKEGTPLTFIHADESFEWPVGEFDVVTMIDVMHHVKPQDQAGMIGRAVAALKPKGLFIYKDMVRTPAWRALANRAHDLVMAQQWIHYCDFGRVVDLARESGLVLERAATINRLWYGHELGIFRRSKAGAGSSKVT